MKKMFGIFLAVFLAAIPITALAQEEEAPQSGCISLENLPDKEKVWIDSSSSLWSGIALRTEPGRSFAGSVVKFVPPVCEENGGVSSNAIKAILAEDNSYLFIPSFRIYIFKEAEFLQGSGKNDYYRLIYRPDEKFQRSFYKLVEQQQKGLAKIQKKE